MAERVVTVLASLLPVLIVVPLFTNLLGGFFGFVQPQTRSVTKTNITNVARVEVQKNFSSTRRFYRQIFLKFKNNTGSTQNYYIRVGAFLTNQNDPVSGKEIYANKITLANGEVFADTIAVSPVENPQTPDPYLNKWIAVELGATANVEIFGYSESEV
jgi:hypothetical protein